MDRQKNSYSIGDCTFEPTSYDIAYTYIEIIVRYYRNTCAVCDFYLMVTENSFMSWNIEYPIYPFCNFWNTDTYSTNIAVNEKLLGVKFGKNKIDNITYLTNL